MEKSVRILVVDDSAFNRRTIIKILEDIPGVEVAGYACNGEEALRRVFEFKPDLITLDLEMPRMDGFTFLRLLMHNRPTPVIVVSARSEDENVFKALELGAVEFVSKPSARISPALFDIREDLVRKVREIARTDMKKVLTRPPAPASLPLPHPRERRRFPENRVSHVVIGASTGGPPALQSIFSAINSAVPIGFAISQHMPPGFTKAFADRLNKFSPLDIREAQSGDIFAPGRVLIAPGGKNLLFRKRSGEIAVEIADPTPDQRYLPSVDAMFSSASETFRDDLLGIILTGMGNDGAKGVVRIKEAGGQTLAESEETSVVFGMPKEAIATSKVDKIVPLPQVPAEILRRCGF